MSAPLGLLAHNVAAIPLAAVGLLTPMPAGAVVAFSSVSSSATESGCAASSRPAAARPPQPPAQPFPPTR
jgi:hypothetical protein